MLDLMLIWLLALVQLMQLHAMSTMPLDRLKASHHGTGRIFPAVNSLYLPVLHQLEPDRSSEVYDTLVQSHNCCSVSLRHDSAMDALKEICEINAIRGGSMTIGASTITSVEQIIQCKNHGAKFISTMTTTRKIYQKAVELDMSILCGVSTYSEAFECLEWGATSLKFYPASDVTPLKLKEILKLLNKNNNAYSFVVAGGIQSADVIPYLNAGATGFALGIDCKKLSIEEVTNKLATFPIM